MSESGVVRLGLIGFGGMGSSHARSIRKGEVPNCALAAVCDKAPARLEAFAKEFGPEIPTFDNAKDLMGSGKVDAVLIATPHYDHPPLAIMAFEHGLHALSEKPAGVYTKQVREMNAAAEKSGKVFGIMFNQRTRKTHQQMRDLVQSGELGELVRAHYIKTDWLRSQIYYDNGDWRGTWAGEGGGVLMNQSPHNLDLFQWICGMPKRIRAFCGYGRHHHIEVEDSVTAYCEYDSGATGIFYTSTGESPGVDRLEVVGDRGLALMEKGKLTFRRNTESVKHVVDTTSSSFPRVESWECQLPTGGGAEHVGILKDFCNAILTGEPLLASGLEGINGVELANAMLLSDWVGDWVDVPVDQELFYEKLQEKIRTSTFEKRVSETAGPQDFAGTF